MGKGVEGRQEAHHGVALRVEDQISKRGGRRTE
jgi:hypothetical protein